MKVWVITGGIACGKSTVSQGLAQRLPDAVLFSADRAVHEELTNPLIVEKVAQVFGSGVLADSQSIDRSRLRQLVLDDDEARGRLEEILHPLVRQRFGATVEEAESRLGSSGLLLAEIPLYHESDTPYPCRGVIAIGARTTTQISRIRDGRGIDEEAAQKFIQSQLPVATKLERSDLALWNDGTVEVLQRQIDLLADFLLAS